MNRQGSHTWSAPTRRSIVPIVLGAVIILSGCSQPQLTASAGLQANDKTLPIGIIGARPGIQGIEGKYTGQGAQLAIDTINQADSLRWQGDIYHLKLAIGSGSDMHEQVANLVKATPTPIAIIGPDEDGPTSDSQALVASTGVPQFTVATAPALTDASHNQGAPTFRIQPSETIIAHALTMYAIQQLGAHAIALATIDTPSYGRTGSDLLQQQFASLSTIPVTRAMLSPGAVDQLAAATSIQAAKADAVICWSTEPEAAILLAELRAANWHGTFLSSTIDEAFLALAGTNADGVIGITSWLPDTSAQQQFIDAYQKRFGMLPDERAAATYDAVQLLAAAIAAVGPNRSAIISYLKTLPATTGIQGKYDAVHTAQLTGNQGDLISNISVVRIQGGQLHLVTRFT
jgi:branched-chain amino acid transport system substrate-binding protein